MKSAKKQCPLCKNGNITTIKNYIKSEGFFYLCQDCNFCYKDNYKTFSSFSNTSLAKRHHFNSANFLSNFSLEKKESSSRESIVSAVLKTEERIEERIKVENVHYKKDSYTFNSYYRDSRPDFFETKILGDKIDNIYSKLYLKLIKNNLSKKEKSLIVIYLLSLHFRHPTFLEYVAKELEPAIHEELEKKSTGRSEEQIKLRKKFVSEFKNNMTVMSLFKQICTYSYFKFLTSLKMQVIEINNEMDFCIGDEPLIMFNQDGYTKWIYNIPFHNLELICLPISRKHLLIFSKFNQIPKKIKDKNFITLINKLQWEQTKDSFLRPNYEDNDFFKFKEEWSLTDENKIQIRNLHIFLKSKNLKINKSYRTFMKNKNDIVFGENFRKRDFFYNDFLESLEPELSIFKREVNPEYILRIYDLIYNSSMSKDLTEIGLAQILKDVKNNID